MIFGIIVKERNKMTFTIGEFKTEFTRTPPEIQFCLMLFRSELKEFVNTVICFSENKQTKNSVIYLRYKIFPSSILPLLNGNKLQRYVNKLQSISPSWAQCLCILIHQGDFQSRPIFLFNTLPFIYLV